mmetsp:Transcript_4300/g.13141  ORF Transcript_4300/g.13141 Transcript_4300/m.13141 type:complete len:323 (-) Transcript_4300:36-1004(-)
MDVDLYLERLRRGRVLSATELLRVCERASTLFVEQPNVLSLAPPVTVVTNLHGHFYDLLEIFRVEGDCPDVNYLFLGGHVDYGWFSLLTISLLLCLKLRYPLRVNLLRGAHECQAVSKEFGLYDECMRVYGDARLWREIVRCFTFLPLAAVLDRRLFAVHGGLSPDIDSVDQLLVLDRFGEPAAGGVVADLLWSEPDSEAKDFHKITGSPGYVFGQNAVNAFCSSNRLDRIVRGHRLCVDGYVHMFEGRLTSLWSAPNFLGRGGNVGATVRVEENLDVYNRFLAAPLCCRKIPDTMADQELSHPSLSSYVVEKPLPDYYLCY